uniref:Ribosomal protein S14 n=1 Tax=Pseudo-nitzschia pungens TaxID=37318 RepID=A0A7T8E6L6_9STRA|nr:ribosomal protein S14 [Pseudo-nitzschia pungens]QQO80617.1 ribosomal protein S14 [Pseudo-nitzschia pungens]
MKKLFAKDRRNREIVKHSELNHFILKQISTNSNFLKTIRWNALYKLSNISKSNSKTVISNRCVQTINRKSFHKFSNFSRMVYLKLVKSGYISGIRKSSW